MLDNKQFLQLLVTRVSKSCFLTAVIKSLIDGAFPISLSLDMTKVEVPGTSRNVYHSLLY